MRRRHSSRIVLSAISGSLTEQRDLFALVNLGLVQSLASGALSPTEAIERFYHAENCLYVRAKTFPTEGSQRNHESWSTVTGSFRVFTGGGGTARVLP